jgi:hypothetical protein
MPCKARTKDRNAMTSKADMAGSKLGVVLCPAPTGRAPAPAAEKAADGGDTTALWAALQTVLMLENVEYRRQ